jgi:threonine dehydrogenase-like Zn-dependent dehydrogenase
MRGLFATAAGKLDILQLPIPEPGPYQALLKTEACGICNSTDKKLLYGQFCEGSWPLLLGHEDVGRVVKLGAGVRNYALGDLVLRGTLLDEHVPYPGGRSCWGGFAEYNLVTDVWARDGLPCAPTTHPQQVVPAGIDAVEATALITLKENLSFVRRCDVVGRTVAIVGTGPVGQAMTLFAKREGARYIAVFGRREQWRVRFEALGADVYVAGDDWPRSVRELLHSGGFERALEAVGSREALAQCVRLVGARGLACVYGVAPSDEPHDADLRKQPNVTEPAVLEAEVHEMILPMVASGQIVLKEWVDVALPLEQYERAFELVWSKQVSKAVITF